MFKILRIFVEFFNTILLKYFLVILNYIPVFLNGASTKILVESVISIGSKDFKVQLLK